MVLAVCTRFGESLDIPLCGIHFTLDGFRCIYGLVVSFMWFVSALLSPQYFRGHRHLRRYYFFFLICLSFTLGVFLSADLYTTFLFFELMSLSSYAWVVQEESPDALDAGKTYLTIAVLGGLVTLMGLFLLWNAVGTLTISELYEAAKACLSESYLNNPVFNGIYDRIDDAEYVRNLSSEDEQKFQDIWTKFKLSMQ